MKSSWKPKELTVHERQLHDELMESIKNGNLQADEYEKKVKELSKILFDPEHDYFTDLIIDYKEAYNRWQNKQGAPTSFFYDEVCMELAYLENCLADTERIIEEESKSDSNYDRTTRNPVIAERFHLENAIRYLQSIEGELKNAMGQQVQGAEPEASQSETLNVSVETKKTLDLLAERDKIVWSSKKSFYIIKSSYSDVKNELEYLITSKKVKYPPFSNVKSFLIENVKSKHGNNLGRSAITSNKRERDKIKHG